MPLDQKLVCSKCGKLKRETEFFMTKDSSRDDMCKDCLTMHIDNRNPDTFMWILEKYDVPYIERNWISLTNKVYTKDPSKFGPKSVIGQYLRSMKMAQYRDYSFADSDKLNFEQEKNEREAAARREAEGRNAEYEAELKRKYEAGEISQAQYETLKSPEPGEEIDKIDFIQPSGVDEEKIQKELTEEDFQYLTLKWGGLYKPSEWVKMEELYNKYASQYEMNVDREETLKKICKTSLKMDQALDIGDMQGFKNLSSVFDQLRKSGKFTEAQNKEDQKKELDSVGELVALVERVGGAIPQTYDPDEFPADKVDLTLKDMKAYYFNLVKNEMGLGDLIESYVEKLEQQMEEDAKKNGLEDGLITTDVEESKHDLSDHEAYEFQNYIEQEIEKDAQLLLEMVEGDSLGFE